MFALLTDIGAAVYGLPVLRTVASLQGVTATSAGHTYRMADLTLQGRQDNGWYEFAEEGVDNIFDKGAAVDVINGGIVNRTYPAKALKPAADQRALRLAELDAFAEGVIYGGMIYQTRDYATDALTMTYHALVGAKGNAKPDSIRSLDGLLTGVNPAEYTTFVEALGGHVTAGVNNRDTHALAIRLLTDPQEIIDYDISTGWPANPAP